MVEEHNCKCYYLLQESESETEPPVRWLILTLCCRLQKADADLTICYLDNNSEVKTFLLKRNFLSLCFAARIAEGKKGQEVPEVYGCLQLFGQLWTIHLWQRCSYSN